MDSQMIIDIIGYTGGGTFAICLIPQIYKSIHTKSTKDISWWWMALYMFAVCCMLAYGILSKLLPVYIPAAVEIAIGLMLVTIKFYFDNLRGCCSGRSNGGGDTSTSGESDAESFECLGSTRPYTRFEPESGSPSSMEELVL